MDMADTIAAWGDTLDVDAGMPEWDAQTPPMEPGAAIAKGAHITVYWTDMNEWFKGMCTSNCLKAADGGGTHSVPRTSPTMQ